MTTPRDIFNTRVLELGLTPTRTDSDGWHSSFTRRDGLHLWRITGGSSASPLGIQTAYEVDGKYTGHMPVYASTYLDALNLAVQRDRKTMWVVFWMLGKGVNHEGENTDHWVVCDDEAEARKRISGVMAAHWNNLQCAGIAPIIDSTEHWHT